MYCSGLVKNPTCRDNILTDYYLNDIQLIETKTCLSSWCSNLLVFKVDLPLLRVDCFIRNNWSDNIF